MDEKIAVIYTSKYGSTQTYAEWIAWAVGADLFPARGRREDLLEYDVIVYGGYLHATGIAGLEYIKKNFDALNGKRLIVFSVGVAPISRDTLDAVLAANFTAAERGQIAVFGLRGAFNYHRLRGKDRIMMSLLRAKLRLKNPASLSEDERALLDAYDNPVNFTDEKTIAPIVKAIQSPGRTIDIGKLMAAGRPERDRDERKRGTGKTKTVKMTGSKPAARKAKRPGRKRAAKLRAKRAAYLAASAKREASSELPAKRKSAKSATKKRTARRAKGRAARKVRPAKRTLKKKAARRARPRGKKRVARKAPAARRSQKKRGVKRAKPRARKRAAKLPAQRSSKKRVALRRPSRRRRAGDKRRVARKRTVRRAKPRGKTKAARSRRSHGGNARRGRSKKSAPKRKKGIRRKKR